MATTMELVEKYGAKRIAAVRRSFFRTMRSRPRHYHNLSAGLKVEFLEDGLFWKAQLNGETVATMSAYRRK